MKISLKILGKIFLICFILNSISFLDVLGKSMNDGPNQFLEKLLNPTIEVNPESLKKQLAIAPPSSILTDEIKEEVQVAVPFVPVLKDGKKPTIYIYSTHQYEEYADNGTVWEISYILAKKLEEAGFYVVVEGNDFLLEADRKGYNYNQLYLISRQFIQEAFVNYGGFDLTIDLHRDAAPKSAVTYVDENGKQYAKMMFVVGMKSDNASTVMNHSISLTDKINAVKPGIMRSVFERQAVYNQDMDPNMILLELGADTNTLEEVLNSLDILVEALKSGGIE